MSFIIRGHSPFVGGKDHTTHHLSYAGLTDPQVAMVFGAIGAFSCFLCAIAAYFIPVWRTVDTLFYAAYALLVFLFLFGLTKRHGIDRSL